MNRWPFTLRLLLAAITGFLIGLLLSLRPSFEALQQSTENAHRLQTALTARQGTLQSLDDLERHVARLERAIKAEPFILPATSEMTGLMASITRSAAESGAEIRSISPDPEAATGLTTTELRLAVAGDWPSMMRFTHALSTMPRLMSINSLALQPVDIEADTRQSPVELDLHLIAHHHPQAMATQSPALTGRSEIAPGLMRNPFLRPATLASSSRPPTSAQPAPAPLQTSAAGAEPNLASSAPEPEPVQTHFLPIRYARAVDLAALIDAPSVRVDERTNTLIITADPQSIAQTKALLARLDVPVRQVLIEARIVIAREDFSDEIGVQFGMQRRNQAGDTVIVSGGGLDDSGLMVDLPVGNAAGSAGLAIGKVGSYLLQLELSAMESENRGEIISSPRVVTASHQQAEIKQGVQIPFEQATSSGATSIAFREAVLGLVVTPQITPDNQVQLALAVNQDSRGEETPEGPAINTQSVKTNVLVADGETVVLGGVFEHTQQTGLRRVPVMADLPIVGGLFEQRSRVDDRSELLVFVTPRILDAPEAPTNALESME